MCHYSPWPQAFFFVAHIRLDLSRVATCARESCDCRRTRIMQSVHACKAGRPTFHLTLDQRQRVGHAAQPAFPPLARPAAAVQTQGREGGDCSGVFHPRFLRFSLSANVVDLPSAADRVVVLLVVPIFNATTRPFAAPACAG